MSQTETSSEGPSKEIEPAGATSAERDAISPRHRFEADPDHTMSFGDHLEDLRRRIIMALGGIIPILVVSLVFGKDLLGLILRPVIKQLHEAGLPQSMQSTGPLETFGAYVQISLIATIVLGGPWIIFQLWKFVSPGLYRHERRFVHFLLPLSAVLTIVGVLFLYFVIMPVMLAFFIKFGSDVALVPPTTALLPEGTVLPTIPVLAADPPSPTPGTMWFSTELQQLRIALPNGVIMGADLTKGAGVVQQYRVNEYVSLFLTLALTFAGAFQTPVVVLLLGWVGILDLAVLTKYRRHAIFVCTIAAAVLTPTADPLTMLLLAGPLYMLYELGVLMLRFLPASRIASPGEGPDAGDE